MSVWWALLPCSLCAKRKPGSGQLKVLGTSYIRSLSSEFTGEIACILGRMVPDTWMPQLSTAKAQKRNQEWLLTGPWPWSLPFMSLLLTQQMYFPELPQKPQHHHQFLSFLRITSLFITGMCFWEGFLLLAADLLGLFVELFFFSWERFPVLLEWLFFWNDCCGKKQLQLELKHLKITIIEIN